ncbi:MAG: methyltransferase domain-containing protein [Opitutae bacterium]|nr:methyltransferase domain-containing protein [Opitutae bacterium]
MQVESAVRERYSGAARQAEAALCCPVNYDPQYLKVIPAEVIERDYGCGDPSRWVQEGDTVLDLGSGTGKICFIAAQVVGPRGRVIGVDMTDDMLGVARRNTPVVAGRIGYANVEFRKGRIQDLALDLERLDAELRLAPAADANGWLAAETAAARLRREHPLVPDGSIDVVVSNCVLNLVEPHLKAQMFAELFRVLRPGGRAVISDIVSDEAVPDALQRDPELWSGCISGAFTEREFLGAFEQAGFHGIELVKYDSAPWRTVQGIEFRSVTVRAYKGKQGACRERLQAVIYKGPGKEFLDDDGHRFRRGVREAVCEKTFELIRAGHYGPGFELIEPRVAVPAGTAKSYASCGQRVRDPRETKGRDYTATTDASACCVPTDTTASVGC